jgi:hypothetical protein
MERLQILYLLLRTEQPSNEGSNDRVIMSAALLGLVKGITEWGNVFFGLIG